MNKILAILLLLPLLNSGCRGYSSPHPPVHPNLNMDTQEKGKAYRHSDFFDDGQYMRMPVEGTIARGQLKDDEHYYFGLVDGKPAESFPSQLVMDEAFIKAGQRKFNQVCAACHSQVGDGDGLVGRRLLVKPKSLHGEVMYGHPPGYFFKVISDGMGTMQSLKHMLNELERWQIVAYIRPLQMSQDMNGAWIERSASWWKQK